MNVLRTEKLQVGMRLGENIYRDDQLVISEGVALTARHIKMICQIGVKSVKILKDELKIEQSLAYKEQYKASVECFKQICFQATIGQMVVYDEVKACLDPLIEELEKNPEMALKLWQIHTADFYTYEHSIKVCMLSVLLAKWMGKSIAYQEDIAKAGLLHDIGKCNIPNEILNKPDTLTEEEFSVMKTHATLGYVLLSHTKTLNREVLKGILHHHERYDGTGYPSKLSGDEIPEYARIVAVVDVFDAMTSNRIYREKMNPFKVLEIMKFSSQGALDTKISELFISRIIQSYLGAKVILNNGILGTIYDISKDKPDRPVIQVGNRFIDLDQQFELEITTLTS